MRHFNRLWIFGIFVFIAVTVIFTLHFLPIPREVTPAFTVSPNQTAPPQSFSQSQQRIREYAFAHGYALEEYHQSLVDLLERNPETEKFVLEYPLYRDTSTKVDLSGYSSGEVPLFMQWDQQWGYIPYGSDLTGLTGCGPVCLSMAAYYLTESEEYAPDKMIAFSLEEGYCIPGDGTSWTLISEGAVDLGFDVTEIPLDEERIMDNLQVGNPIICVVGPGDFTSSGHYILFAGCEDGKIKIHDPNSYINSERLWSYSEIADQLEVLWVIRKF